MEKGTIHKLFDHFFTNHQDEVILAMAEFFDNDHIDHDKKLELKEEHEQGLFMEWIAFDYRLQNGKKIIEDFIAENPLRLTRKSLRVYEGLQMNKYGWFEILKVKRDEYIDLESLQSGKKYRVLEKMGTHDAEAKTTLACRIGKVDDHWELVGSDPVGYPVYHTERMKKLMRQDKSVFSPKEMRKLLVERGDQPTKFEKSLKMKDEEIIKKQNQVKQQLEMQLARSKRTTDVEDILKIVYKAKNNDDMAKIIDLLDDGKFEITQELVDLASDGWNYFPHRDLGGKSPAEKAKELYGKPDKN